MKRLVLASLVALFLPSCTAMTVNSTVTKDAHKITALDVHYFPRASLRIQTTKASSSPFVNTRIDEAQLTRKAGEAMAVFGKKLVESFPAVARSSDLAHRLSVSQSAVSTGPAMSEALHGMKFAKDDALVFYPSSGEVFCYEGYCSVYFTFRSLLYDAKTKRTMWYGDHKIMVGDRFVGARAADATFDATTAVEAYWSSVFGTLRSERLLEKDAVVKLQ